MVENTDYAKFVSRSIRAFGRRAGTDVDALVLLKGLRDEIDTAMADGVHRLHTGASLSNGGFSYGEIAQRLGVTRQAVQKLWGGNDRPKEVHHGETERPAS